MNNRHIVTPNTPHTIQKRNASGQWEAIAYRPNLAATDATLRQLIAFNAGNGVRFRAIPFSSKLVTV